MDEKTRVDYLDALADGPQYTARIAALEAEIKRGQEALKHVLSMATQDIMLDEYGSHTNEIVLVARAALEPAQAEEERDE